MGDPHYNIFSFLIIPSLQSSSNSFLKTDSCYLLFGCGFAWCGFASGCSSMSTCLSLQVPKVMSKSNLYLVNRVCSAMRPSSGRYLFSSVT